MPFNVGWGLLHLGLLPLIFLVLDLAALRNNSCFWVIAFGGLLVFWTLTGIHALGFECWAAGTIVNIVVVAIPIGILGRLLGLG